MSTRLKLEGRVFDDLEVLSFAGSTSARNAVFLVRCTCGVEKTVLGKNLKNGTTKSCGCKNMPRLLKSHTSHGQSRRKNRTPEFRSWGAMKQRCYNLNNKDYSRYGGRGISVCRKWLNSFVNFVEDMGIKPTPKHTLERINNGHDYKPSNCKWATAKEQANNRRPKMIKERRIPKCHPERKHVAKDLCSTCYQRSQK